MNLLPSSDPVGMPVRHLQLLVQFLQNQNVNVSSLLTQSGIDLQNLHSGEARLPWHTMYRAWRNAEEVLGESTLGLAVLGRVQMSLQIDFIPSWFLLPQLFLHSATLGEALERVARCSGAMLGLGRWQFTRGKGGGEMSLLLPGEPPRSLTNFLFFWPIICSDFMFEHPVTPQEVSCSASEPMGKAEYERLLKVPIHFGSTRNAIRFAERDLAAPSKRADPALCQSLERTADEILAKLFPSGGLIEQVKGLIRAELGGRKPNADFVAWALGMSPRTLARRLATEGTSYQDIVDQIRAEQAQHYLEKGLSVQEVSQILGFAFPSSFCRAYARWFGRSPGENLEKSGKVSSPESSLGGGDPG